MHCNDTFTAEEVEKILVDQGLKPGTHDFFTAKRTQFFPAEGIQGHFVDHPAYEPSQPVT